MQGCSRISKRVLGAGVRWRSIAMDVRLSNKLLGSKVTAHGLGIIIERLVVLLLCNKLVILVSLILLLLGNRQAKRLSLKAWRWHAPLSNLLCNNIADLFGKKFLRDRHLRRR